MRVVHLYPFVPRGRHGGTLRLAAAIDASATIGDPEVHYFDPDAGGWHGPVDRAALEHDLAAAERGGDARASEAGLAPRPSLESSLKRRLFPSTLWESGIAARRAMAGHADRLALDTATIVFLHTSYLAGLSRSLAPSARGTVADVYDLVWRAHRNDARAAPALPKALRTAYSRAVRPREEAALRRSDAVVVAGYEDWSLLARRISSARWIPTSTPVEAVPPPAPRDGIVRVGVLGNFAHAATRLTAERVLRSPLAGDPGVLVLLGGLGSRAAIPPRAGVDVFGAVDRAEDFYSRIDCVVAPVEGGSGIKCKLGEGLLAGRPVITTPLGAAGFSPALRSHFTVCDPNMLEPELVRRVVNRFEAASARDAAQRELGYGSVVDRYAAAIEDVAGHHRS